MMERIKNVLHYHRETLAYLFFGVLTVVFNTVLFMLLGLFWNELTANTVAFFLSVLFAYWTNTLFVFQQKMGWKTFSAFLGMRIGTIIIDNGGLYLFLYLGTGKLLAKCIVNATIIILNYLFSKFVIYRKGD